MNTEQKPDRYKWVEWPLAILFLAGFAFFGVPALAIILPSLAIVGFLHWGMGTRRPR